MDATALLALVQESVPGAQVEAVPGVDPQLTVYVSRDGLPAVARALRDRPDLRFDLLVDLTAVDFLPANRGSKSCTCCVSIEHRDRLRLKVRLDGADAHVSSVSNVWPAANWLEPKSGTCSGSSSTVTRIRDDS